MKPNIHPKYYPTARVMCACGHTWTTGATQPEIRVDVCSNCHPFYTGEQRIVDTAGRVDRFRMRLAQKREQKVEKIRKEKFVIVGPDETSARPEPTAAPAMAESASDAGAPTETSASPRRKGARRTAPARQDGETGTDA
ncbi:MAG: 50S ribosomal protein L31 [Chloroflexi bacterium]|nr:50S ribosomal protein L31 [Chloroflexota bacterium]